MQIHKFDITFRVELEVGFDEASIEWLCDELFFLVRAMLVQLASQIAPSPKKRFMISLVCLAYNSQAARQQFHSVAPSRRIVSRRTPPNSCCTCHTVNLAKRESCLESMKDQVYIRMFYTLRMNFFNLNAGGNVPKNNYKYIVSFQEYYTGVFKAWMKWLIAYSIVQITPSGCKRLRDDFLMNFCFGSCTRELI